MRDVMLTEEITVNDSGVTFILQSTFPAPKLLS